MNSIRPIFLLIGALTCPITSFAVQAFNWDFQTYYPFALTQPTSLTADQLAQVTRFNSFYGVARITPNNAGLTAAEVSEVAAMPAYYGLSRDPTTGALSGRGIVVDGEGSLAEPDLTKKASFNGDFITNIFRLNALYGKTTAAQRPAVEAVYKDLVEHFIDQNYLPGGITPIWMGNGYTYRNRGAGSLFRMANVLAASHKDLFALSIFYISGGAGNLLKLNAYGSTDEHLNYFPTGFNALQTITDGTAKWQLLNLVRRGLDVSITSTMEWASGASTPKNQLIPQDGSILHHEGHHISYAAYSFIPLVNFHINMAKVGITSSYTAGSVKRIRKAALAWAFTTTGGLNPLHMQMRSAFPSGASLSDGGVGNNVSFLKAAADLTAAYQGTALGSDLEMAYAAIQKAGVGNMALPVEWRNISLPSTVNKHSELYTSLLMGHYSHTTNGASVHRGADWMATIRGAHNYWRGGEAYDAMGQPDHFNVKAMHGALLIYAAGKSCRIPNEVDSGYRYEGWDPYFFPNVTTTTFPLNQLLYWRTPAYFGGNSDLMGSANLHSSGIWMYHYPDHDKSAFFLDNRIVLVTNNITSTSPRHTGLIQQAHDLPGTEAVTLDGVVRNTDGNWTLAAGGDHTLLDATGNAYFVHAVPSNPSLTLRRGTQARAYALSSQWIGSGAAPSYTSASDFIANQTWFTPTSAYYSLAWFDHGPAPSNASLEYTVFVRPTAGQVEAYATTMKGTTPPVLMSRTANYHYFKDTATNTEALAVFKIPMAPPSAAQMTSVNRPGAYIWRADANGYLRLSVSSSQISNKTAFTVVLKGSWAMHDAENSNATAATDSNQTTVTIPYQEAYPLNVVLEPA